MSIPEELHDFYENYIASSSEESVSIKNSVSKLYEENCKKDKEYVDDGTVPSFSY